MSNNELILPIYCLYELLTKSTLLNNIHYKETVNRTLTFIMKNNIKIAYLDKGKLIYRQTNGFDFWGLDVKKQFLMLIKAKLSLNNKKYMNIFYIVFLFQNI